MEEKKHAGGRPPKYKTKEEMQEKIDKYFAECDKERDPYTVTGLAMALDIDRRTLLNYSEKDEFFPTIKKAKLRVENYLEKRLIKDSSTTGIIFNLKNNYGWKDNVEVADKDKLAKVEELLTKIEEEADK